MEATTLHCQSCGASVGENDLQCPYCKSQLATVACPKCFGMVGIHATHCPRCGSAIERAPAEGRTALACPSCGAHASLTTTAVGGVSLDQCHACGGLWVGQHNFEQIAADRAERGEVLGALPGEAHRVPVHLEAVHYRPCPQCGKLMNRTNYGRISGVVLDVCKDHGLWFDQDKFREVLEFIEGGGLEKSHARQAQEEAEQRRMPAGGSSLPMGAWTEGPVQMHGSGLISAFESLVQMLRG